MSSARQAGLDYTLPLYARGSRQTARDGKTSATVSDAVEVYMSSPTRGDLSVVLTSGLGKFERRDVNPQLLFSADSRLLVCPVWWFRTFRRAVMRVGVVELGSGHAWLSRGTWWWVYPTHAAEEVTVVTSAGTTRVSLSDLGGRDWLRWP